MNFSIKLDSTICPNEKAYFCVKESEVADSKAFAAIAIAAKSSGQLIRIQYELVGIQHCYVTGIELRY